VQTPHYRVPRLGSPQVFQCVTDKPIVSNQPIIQAFFIPLYSYRYNRDVDRQGTPNIGTLMFVPYLRIVPMHLTIVFGISRAHSTIGLLFFGGLKTAADMAMHYVEHARLQRGMTL
jgi:hypothetical protein